VGREREESSGCGKQKRGGGNGEREERSGEREGRGRGRREREKVARRHQYTYTCTHLYELRSTLFTIMYNCMCMYMYSIELSQYDKLAYCVLHARCSVLYCNTDVVIIKPVTGRARIRSASLKTTRRLIALDFHKEKEKEVCQRSHSSDPVPIHVRAICCSIYCSMQYIGMSK